MIYWLSHDYWNTYFFMDFKCYPKKEKKRRKTETMYPHSHFPNSNGKTLAVVVREMGQLDVLMYDVQGFFDKVRER